MQSKENVFGLNLKYPFWVRVRSKTVETINLSSVVNYTAMMAHSAVFGLYGVQ